MRNKFFKPEFILEVLLYTDDHTVNQTARKYNFSIENIYRWKRTKKNIINIMNDKFKKELKAKETLKKEKFIIFHMGQINIH